MPPAGSGPGAAGGRPTTDATSHAPPISSNEGVLSIPLASADHPERIGPYKVVRILGKGGMGVVLLAVRDDDQFHKRVAIKLIRRGIDGGADSRDVLKRFELERQVLSALNHPNIARLLDAGQTPGPDPRPYFVMEYVEGEPIDEYCDRMQLTTEERLRLLQKVCAAVHHAHQNLVVHRDIKPANILVCAPAPGSAATDAEPKLMDFGIAKLLNPEVAGLTYATKGDLGPMTPEYASPEQVQGKPVSTASDVYALGVLMYELLTGRRPYRLKTRLYNEIVKAICEEDPERPSTVVTRELTLETDDGDTRTVSPEDLAKPREGPRGGASRLRRKLAGDIDNIVLMAMRKSPQRRYSSAQALADDIGRHLGGEPVKACAETWWYVGSKFVRRHRLPVAAAALTLAAVVGSGAYAAYAWRREAAALAGEREARARQARAVEGLRSVADAAIRSMSALASPAADEAALRARTAEVDEVTADAERLAKELPDADLRPQLAGLYAVQGRVRADVRGRSAGDAAAALAHLDRAVAARRAVLAERPGDAAAVRGLVTALVYQGDARSRAGRSAEALGSYDEAVGLARPAGGAAPGPEGRLLATSLLAAGDALLDTDPARADAYFTESFALRRAAAAQAPDDPVRQRDLSVGHGRMADVAGRAGKPEEAERHLREALAIRERAARSDESSRARRDLAVARGALADFLVGRGRAADAMPLLEAQARACADLTAEEPKDARARTDAVRAWRCLAAARASLGDASRARAEADRAVRLVEAPSPPPGPQFAHESALAYETRGDCRAALREDAAEDYAKAADLLAPLAGARGGAFDEDLARVRGKAGGGPP